MHEKKTGWRQWTLILIFCVDVHMGLDSLIHMRPPEPDPLPPLRVDVINGWPLVTSLSLCLSCSFANEWSSGLDPGPLLLSLLLVGQPRTRLNFLFCVCPKSLSLRSVLTGIKEEATFIHSSDALSFLCLSYGHWIHRSRHHTSRISLCICKESVHMQHVSVCFLRR